MSLLSENAATANASSYVVSTDSLTLPQKATQFLTLDNAAYKQALGYVAVRDQAWTPVLDVFTGKPLQLPQGYVPTGFYFKAVQDVPNNSRLEFLTIDSVIDPYNADYDAIIFFVGSQELNPGVFVRVSPNTSGEDYENRNYVIVFNTDYQTNPLTTGLVQVIVTYF